MIDLRCLRYMLALAWIADASSAYAVTVSADSDPILSVAQVHRLSDHELSEQRGGFRWGGLELRFGAELRSYLGDDLVMQTNVNWDDMATAAEVQRTTGAAFASFAPAESGLDVGQTRGYTVIANEGQTAFIQRADGTIQNIIVNMASNVDLRQQVDARLDIGGFAPFRAGLLAARIGTALSGMRGLAALRGWVN